MKIYREESLVDFEFWGGAVAVATRLTDDELYTIESMLEDTEENFSDVQINDFFWFDTEIICDWLGIDEDKFWERPERVSA